MAPRGRRCDVPFRILLGTMALLGAGLALGPAEAQPPDNADPALAPWFKSLRDPLRGDSCCAEADCRPVEYRTIGDGYQVFIGRQFRVKEGFWEDVDPSRILQRTDNPTGRAVACWMPALGVMCFIRAPES